MSAACITRAHALIKTSARCFSGGRLARETSRGTAAMPRPGRFIEQAGSLEQLLGSALERSSRYLTQLDARSVQPKPASVAGLERLNEQLPASPSDPMRTLALL